jgi:hypothetical protein
MRFVFPVAMRRRTSISRPVSGPNPVESFRGRLELHLAAFVVAELTVRQSHERANARDLIGHIQLAPHGAGLAQQRDCRGGVSIGQRHGA